MILHTEVKGSGEAILFLHSGLQTSTTDFLQQQTAFSNGYQVVLPDLRGHGKSKSADISNFFEDSAKDLEETCLTLGLQSVHVVGASLGALVALFLAKRFPSRVKSLTLSGITKQKPKNWQHMHQEDVEAQADLLNNKEAVKFLDHLHGPDWPRFIEMAKNEEWYPFHETGEVSAISSPVLIIAGAENANESNSALEFKNQGKHVHAAILPFASHLVHMEQPELYTSVLALFLKNK